jgi:hypothetical protein
MIDDNLLRKLQSKMKKFNYLTVIYRYTQVSNQMNALLLLSLKFEHKGKKIYKRKHTLVWLSTEGQSVSTDWLFRVRSIQPFANKQQCVIESTSPDRPYKDKVVATGDMCVFMDDVEKYRVGKVLQFSYYKVKTKTSQEYKWKSADIQQAHEKDNIGVLCIWYNKCGTTFSINNNIAHIYYPLSKYIFSLPYHSLIT